MEPDADFDVIVVGAGAAGCALAYKLTADSDLKVLLLEAGPDERPESVSVPARWPEAMAGPLDYGYATVPQPAAGGRVLPAPRGRVLGGTTAMNAMIYSPPARSDLAPWGAGWSYDDCAQAIKAMESYNGDAGSSRGTTGPAVNGPGRAPNQLNLDFVQACIEAGHLANDVTKADGGGAGCFDLSIGDDGERADAAQCFLRRSPRRTNLHIWADVAVKRLTFDGPRVTALTLVRSGNEVSLRVSGQLVLSAGAVDTPTLLLRSGIGPAGELRAAGIDPVLDVPGVGRNLQDHPAIPVMWSSKTPIAPPRNQFAETTLLLRNEPRTGGQTISMAFHHVALLPPEAGPPPHGATALIGLYEPHSRGAIRLNPDDADGPPLIDPGYLSDARDVVALAAGVALARTIAQQSALRRYGLEEFLPGPAVEDAEDAQEFVRQNASTYGHLASTCALGTSHLSVVDARLRVSGTTNLRIADASVIPRIPAVAISATVQMIGWRAAEMILADIDEHVPVPDRV